MNQLAFAFRPPRRVVRRQVLVWVVIAVDGDGQGHGNCEHAHATQDEATACPWAPAGWDDMLVCDLLVRQVRDRRIDPPRARRSKAA